MRRTPLRVRKRRIPIPATAGSEIRRKHDAVNMVTAVLRASGLKTVRAELREHPTWPT